MWASALLRIVHEGVPPVPARTVQEQSLSQNLSKLVGACGQLKCCLRHELDFYREAKDRFPPVGSIVACCGGGCRVQKNNIFEDRVQIRHWGGEVEALALVEVEKIQQDDQNERGCEA